MLLPPHQAVLKQRIVYSSDSAMAMKLWRNKQSLTNDNKEYKIKGGENENEKVNEWWLRKADECWVLKDGNI